MGLGGREGPLGVEVVDHPTCPMGCHLAVRGLTPRQVPFSTLQWMQRGWGLPLELLRCREGGDRLEDEARPRRRGRECGAEGVGKTGWEWKAEEEGGSQVAGTGRLACHWPPLCDR